MSLFRRLLPLRRLSLSSSLVGFVQSFGVAMFSSVVLTMALTFPAWSASSEESGVSSPGTSSTIESASGSTLKPLPGRVAVDFRDAPISEVVEAVYGNALHRAWSVSPAIKDRRISLSANFDSPEAADGFLREFLPRNGVSVSDGPVVSFEAVSSPSVLDKALDTLGKPLRGVAGGSERLVTRVYRSERRGVGAASWASEFGKVFRLSDSAIALQASYDSHLVFDRLWSEFDSLPRAFRVRVALVEFRSVDSSSIGIQAALDALGLVVKMAPLAGVSSLSYSSSKFSVVLNAVASDGRFSLVQTGSLLVASGKTGRVSVGSEVPVLSSTTAVQGAVTQSVQYRPSGVVVEVSPLFDGEIVSGKVLAEVSSVVRTQTSGIDSPTVNKRAVSSDVHARLGEVVILGGLEEKRRDYTVSRFLGLPVGAASDDSTATVLVLLSFELV